ncbi:acyltransferase family protein [Clostridium sp. WILCCON 0269]|uniref:Acyltransferase family protein n=1 Tax=Candidatus Clostridium eludens TaxID=3381663 RepID=A0ABW8SLY0_9CLOT
MNNILKSIRLDHDIMKSRYPMFVIAYILGIFLAVISKTPFFGALVVMVISAPLIGQYFSIYEKNNLEKLYGVLPLRKSEIVIGRYIYALCIVVINGIIAAILAYIISFLTNKGISNTESLTYLSAAFFYVCLMIAVIFPLYFKFSFSKVYVFSNLPFYLIFIITFAFTRKTNVLKQAGPAVQNLTSNLTIAAIGLVLGLILLALSCLLSCALTEGNRMISLPAEEPGKRLYFADNLRTWMVILVVLQHLGETFGLYLFLMLNQAYFMGLLFLLSGYFTPGSYERKGPSKFLMDRMLRLGIPTLVYVFIISPLDVWGSHRITHKPIGNLFALDQMWFAVMLLVFDLGYLAWRTIVNNSPERPADDAPKKLTFPKVALFTLALAAASYLLRSVIPYGIPVLEFPSLGYLAQYLSFFLIGMLVFRQGWLRSVTGSLGKLGFVLAVLATVILFPTAIFIGSGSKWIGYGSWQSAVFALWDSIFAVGISLALITFFRRFLDGGKKFGRFLSRHSFAVYVIHVPVIVFLMLAMRSIHINQLLKFGLVAVIGVPLCFGAAYLIRLIPYAKEII